MPLGLFGILSTERLAECQCHLSDSSDSGRVLARIQVIEILGRCNYDSLGVPTALDGVGQGPKVVWPGWQSCALTESYCALL